MSLPCRAFKVMDEVMARGILPRFDPESPLQLDMGKVPPSVAEVYCMHALLTLERRALKLGHTHYHHAFTFLVPPFDPDLIKWPSYVEKVNRHYTLHVSAKAMQLLQGSLLVLHQIVSCCLL